MRRASVNRWAALIAIAAPAGLGGAGLLTYGLLQAVEAATLSGAAALFVAVALAATAGLDLSRTRAARARRAVLDAARALDPAVEGLRRGPTADARRLVKTRAAAFESALDVNGRRLSRQQRVTAEALASFCKSLAYADVAAFSTASFEGRLTRGAGDPIDRLSASVHALSDPERARAAGGRSEDGTVPDAETDVPFVPLDAEGLMLFSRVGAALPALTLEDDLEEWRDLYARAERALTGARPVAAGQPTRAAPERLTERHGELTPVATASNVVPFALRARPAPPPAANDEIA